MSESKNIWNGYGLRGNPFNPDPLQVYGGALPIEESFIGREEEFKQITKHIHSNNTSRILIYGNICIGKTTFANYVRFESQNDYFTPLGELGVQYDWTPQDFMFNTVQYVYSTIERNESIREKFNPDILQELKVLFGSERGIQTGIGANAFGFGITSTKGKQFAPQPTNPHALKLLFQEVLDEIQHIGYKGTIIHYNNLELIQDKGENQLISIMNGIRDFLQVEGAHFLFVSETSFFELFHQIPRIEGIFKTPILLTALTPQEIKKILEKRVSLLRISSDITPINPVDDETLEILYDLYEGNLRGILRSLDCAINNIESATPTQINPMILKYTLYHFSNNRFVTNINATEKKVLNKILEKKETTNKNLCEAFGMLPQNVAPILTNLRDIGAIRLARTEAQKRFYSPSQEALWLKLNPTLNTPLNPFFKKK